MSKSLFILVDGVDLSKVDKKLFESADRLALSSFAMRSFEIQGLDYKTAYDFYDQHIFRQKVYELARATEDVFKNIDKRYESVLNYPRAFTGNICQFANYFFNLHFMTTVCASIKDRYEDIYLVGSEAMKGSVLRTLEFSLGGVTLARYSSRLCNKAEMIQGALSLKEMIWVGDKKSRKNPDFLNPYKWLGLKECAYSLLNRASRKSQKNGGTVFIMQNGYDVQLVEEYLTEYSYVSPFEFEKNALNKEYEKNQNIPMVFKEVFTEFSAKWFPGLEHQAVELCEAYHNQIVSKIDSFQKYVASNFDKYKPKAVLYALYVHNILEDVYAYVANQRNIPVFYFQHGGTRVFTVNENDRYHEQNHNIDKINIFHSQVEFELSQENLSKDSRVFGSAKLYRLYEQFKKQNRRSNKKVLYCLGPHPFYTYRDVVCNMSDPDIVSAQKEIMKQVIKLNLNMDIKLNRGDELNQNVYVRNMLRDLNARTLRVLSGFPVERIINKYGLIVMDYVATALLPLCSILNIPVILYLKEQSFLRGETLEDLKQRFYIVSNKEELEDILQRHKEGQLPSKFSKEFVDQYIFPIDQGSPAENIAQYIRDYLSCKNSNLPNSEELAYQ